MSGSIDDSLPPRPDTAFDFNLPHGIDTEEHAPSTGQTVHDFADREPNDPQYDHDQMEDIQHTAEPKNNVDLYDQDTGEQEMNYELMPKGFSDDEDAGEAFDRSWSIHQAQKSPPKNKKSPKRSSDDGDEEAIPTTKKPRVSLFGGPMDEDEEERSEEEPEKYGVDRDEDVAEPKTPGHGIGNRLSSLNLEQQEREVSPTERPLNVGFGLPLSDRGSDRSMSPTPPPDTPEENVCIPPDTEVSSALNFLLAYCATTYIVSPPTNFAQTSKERRLSPTSTRTPLVTLIRQKTLDRKSQTSTKQRPRRLQKQQRSSRRREISAHPKRQS
jgi:hypothetical protein